MDIKYIKGTTVNVGCSFCKEADIIQSNVEKLENDNDITIIYDVECSDCASKGRVEEKWSNKNKPEKSNFHIVFSEGVTFYCPYCDSPDLKLSNLKEGKEEKFFVSKYKLKCNCGGTAHITERWLEEVKEATTESTSSEKKDYVGEIIVITGVQGSGKSTLYEKLFKDTHVRVNLDTLKTRPKEDKLIKECINEQKSFVIDNTNVSIDKRKKYIDIAKQNNYKVVSYYIPTPREVAIARNDQREGKARVAKVVIYTALKNLVQPSKEEGFDELYIVDNSSNDYIVSKK